MKNMIFRFALLLIFLISGCMEQSSTDKLMEKTNPMGIKIGSNQIEKELESSSVEIMIEGPNLTEITMEANRIEKERESSSTEIVIEKSNPTDIKIEPSDVEKALEVNSVELVFEKPIEIPKFNGDVTIDWIDFVNINDRKYVGTSGVIIAKPSLVNENDVVGEVEFKLEGVVKRLNYKIKDGDAAFLSAGTKLYSIVGYEDETVIAAKDDRYIHGYNIYNENNQSTLSKKFSQILKLDIEKIEIYKFSNLETPLQTLEGGAIKSFISLLENGRDEPDYPGVIEVENSDYYHIAFYTGGAFAHTKTLIYDGDNYLFHSWSTSVVSNEIEQFLK
ncbi:hypothetical protein [Chengkuizengella axinellae]|uniref:Uncharacterized protein n=1 Tax=Chengkuizengella axinellae TaxID=3064388 RepID=A0ABT9J628_9BACL|nr:hypothetical protein [Chengkuizengella sp. 2205SS18-9]MDP5277066.1 hypothetical protein [Chengkuizengella sp. 2205SS18-9]